MVVEEKKPRRILGVNGSRIPSGRSARRAADDVIAPNRETGEDRPPNEVHGVDRT
jgi:hypothetical protein